MVSATHLPVTWRVTDEGLKAFRGEKELGWAPQPGSQVYFLACPTFEVIYEGTRGPGKTEALLVDFGKDCGRGFGAEWTGVLFRRTYPELQDVIRKSRALFTKIWPAAKYNESEHFWTWPSGERLYFRQFDKPRDYWKYHGHEYAWIGWEELTTWPVPDGYTKTMSLCRSTHPGINARVRSTTNPFGVGHNWVKDRFRLPIPPGQTVGPLIDDARDEEGNLEKTSRRAIHGFLDENKVLLHAQPDYKDILRTAASSEAELKAWLHGSWDIVAGGMFDDVWDPKVHVVPEFVIPKSWRLDRSFDWGSSKPFSVGWWAESDGTDVQTKQGWRSTVRGDLFRIHEWYGWTGKPNVGSKMLASEIAKGIIERELEWGIHGRVKVGPADPSIHKTENGVCLSTDMGKQVRINGSPYKGVQWTKADNTRIAGWEQMRRMLKDAKHDTDKEGRTIPRERVGLFVFDCCAQFRRTVPVLPRDEIKMDDVDTDAEDHVGDEVRYRVRTVGNRPRQGTHVGMY